MLIRFRTIIIINIIRRNTYNFSVYIETDITTLILGTSYLIENKISIDFGNLLISQNIATLPPHSELGLGGKLVKNILFIPSFDSEQTILDTRSSDESNRPRFRRSYKYLYLQFELHNPGLSW
jgi:hypothetical protein